MGNLIVKNALAVSGESRALYSVLLFSTFMHNGARSSAPMAGLPIRQFPRVRRQMRTRKLDATPTSVRSSGQILGGLEGMGVMSKEQTEKGAGGVTEGCQAGRRIARSSTSALKAVVVSAVLHL